MALLNQRFVGVTICTNETFHKDVRIIQIKIETHESQEEIEIVIKCLNNDERIERLTQLIQQQFLQLSGKKDDKHYLLYADDLFYVEAVNNRTFLYDEHAVYECEHKLYEIEVILQNTNFLRISKHLIVNISKIQFVRALFNGRFEATLMNNEKVIVNRHYAKQFKNTFLK